MSQEIGFSEEEKQFWQCGTCENSLADCECGTKQEVHEINKLQKIFGVEANQALIKLVPGTKKVRIETNFLMIWNDNFYELKELGFEILFLEAFRGKDRFIVELGRI